MTSKQKHQMANNAGVRSDIHITIIDSHVFLPRCMCTVDLEFGVICANYLWRNLTERRYTFLYS